MALNVCLILQVVGIIGVCQQTKLRRLDASRAYLLYYSEGKVQDKGHADGRRKPGMVNSKYLKVKDSRLRSEGLESVANLSYRVRLS